MNKKLLATAILSSIALMGCDDDSTQSTPNDSIAARNVAVSVLTKDVGEMSVASGIDYNLPAVKDGYTVVINELEDGGEDRTVTGVTVSNGAYVEDLSVVGEALINIYHPDYIQKEETYSEYVLRGTANIGKYDDSVTVMMTNERFTQVTMDENESDMYFASVNDVDMYDSGNGWLYSFVDKTSQLKVDTRAGVFTDTVEDDAGTRYSYALSIDELGRVSLDEKWKDGDVNPSDPVVSSSDMVGNTIRGWDLDTGVTRVEVTGTSNALSSPSISRNVAPNKPLNAYDWNVDVEHGYGMYINIYLGGNCQVSRGGHIVYYVDQGVFTDASQRDYSNPVATSWEELLKTPYGEKTVSYCTELPMGNFFLRTSPEDDNEGALFTVTEYSF